MSGGTMDRRTVARSAAVLAAALLSGGAGGTARARTREAAGARDTAPAGTRDAARAAGADLVLTLPAPTGRHRVGVTTLYLVDRDRRDPWAPEVPVREVMATVLYPARTVRGCPRAPQMTRKAAKSFAGFVPIHQHPELPEAGVDWAATLTHGHTGAPAQPVRRPVVLYSPGGGDARTLGTGIAEELASHGYVVVTVDHPGDASEVEFPNTTAYRDDPLRTTVFRGDPRTDPGLFRTMIETRVADVRFVLDRLAVLAAGGNPDAAGRPLPEHLGRALDLRRVGVYGHSAGGTTAAQALYEDRRIAAAIDLEGYLDHPARTPGGAGELFPVARDGVDRPLLLVRTDGFRHGQALEPSWSAVAARSGGRVRRCRVDRAGHAVFTDYAAFAPQLQAAGLMSSEDRAGLVGTLEPAVSVPLVRDRVRGFFTRHLGRPGHLV
ncbi:alpha/beta hydrolase family protein [Streptomyces sp. NPDC093595]|uniref:alpha/beta hydrolase family protein n=1 Tax=Streptomyces sp. NPDC093595 TaxID=3366045 RepID=UPI00382C82C8